MHASFVVIWGSKGFSVFVPIVCVYIHAMALFKMSIASLAPDKERPLAAIGRSLEI